MKKARLALIVLFGASAMLFVAALATAGSGSSNFRARGGLSGYQETPATLSTTANGTFRARVADNGQSFHWTLSYAALEGTITQAHIHFGARALGGGISVWLCGTATNPGPAGTQVCPPPPATIEGDADAADVIGPAAQGIAPTEFAELLAAVRAGATYANVHSTKYGGGEMRGQLSSGGGDDNGDDDDD